MTSINPKRSTSKRPAYRNTSDIRTDSLHAIVNSHHTTGIDGADYAPILHELEQELWKRQAQQGLNDIKQFLAQQAELFKHQSKSHKLTSKTVNA